MLFNSFSFLIFFPIVVFLYFVIPVRFRNVWLVVASYFFYMSWNAKYGLLIAFSTVVTYVCARLIEAASGMGVKKLVLALCIFINVGILFFFKYLTWLISEWNTLLGTEYALPIDIILPVGISFYTFQALGYTIDVYRGNIAAERNFITYALYVSFFPQLVAGPIERSGHLLCQLGTPAGFDRGNAVRGLQYMLYGYVEKVVIADNLAIIVDQVYADHGSYGGGILYLTTVLFAFQIYCDFGGYSHIAIGAAKVLGVDLLQNFRQPFFARDIKSFWQRWHISLNKWLVDYIYIPLGGSRCGRVRRRFNLMVTCLVSGIWHGASWHYVAWGAVNGLYQIVGEKTDPFYEKLAKAVRIDTDGRGYVAVQRFVTFNLFVISLIFFRSVSISDSLQVFRSIIFDNRFLDIFDISKWGIEGIYPAQILWVVIAVILMFIVETIHESGKHISELYIMKNAFSRIVVYYVVVLFLIVAVTQTFGRSASAFLYFQF